MKIKQFETGKVYTTVTGSTVKIIKRTAKMCIIETRFANGLFDSEGSGRRKIHRCFTNDENYDRVEMLNPWGAYCVAVFSNRLAE